MQVPARPFQGRIDHLLTGLCFGNSTHATLLPPPVPGSPSSAIPGQTPARQTGAHPPGCSPNPGRPGARSPVTASWLRSAVPPCQLVCARALLSSTRLGGGQAGSLRYQSRSIERRAPWCKVVAGSRAAFLKAARPCRDAGAGARNNAAPRWWSVPHRLAGGYPLPA